ncbi:esterase/lipase family protein [Coraliomargarita sp. W4R53]
MSLIPSTLPAQEHVILLHGLARTASSMQKMELALTNAGYQVHNLSYDSRHLTIEEQATEVAQQIKTTATSAARVHIVTHSLGGILVRQIQATTPLPNLGRVVMLSPPNQGSEVVDIIGHWWLFQKINGPAGQQLGTRSDGFIKQLPAIDFECGILTGDRSINWINSLMIPGKDDGKVSVTSAQSKGTAAYKVMHVTHPYIMKKKAVIQEVLHFLKTGTFQPA